MTQKIAMVKIFLHMDIYKNREKIAMEKIHLYVKHNIAMVWNLQWYM